MCPEISDGTPQTHACVWLLTSVAIRYDKGRNRRRRQSNYWRLQLQPVSFVFFYCVYTALDQSLPTKKNDTDRGQNRRRLQSNMWCCSRMKSRNNRSQYHSRNTPEAAEPRTRATRLYINIQHDGRVEQSDYGAQADAAASTAFATATSTTVRVPATAFATATSTSVRVPATAFATATSTTVRVPGTDYLLIPTQIANTKQRTRSFVLINCCCCSFISPLPIRWHLHTLA